MPTIFDVRDYVDAGGLVSYGTDFLDVTRLAGSHVGRVLKDEKAADLPVQQTTKFELVINLKTAQALRIDVPPGLLSTADERDQITAVGVSMGREADRSGRARKEMPRHTGMWQGIFSLR